jgi:hypothetical protein
LTFFAINLQNITARLAQASYRFETSQIMVFETLKEPTTNFDQTKHAFEN